METKDAIIAILNKHSCLTASELKGYAYRMFNVEFSPQSAAGVMRTLIAKGYAERGNNPSSNKTVYWLTDYGKEILNKKTGEINAF